MTSRLRFIIEAIDQSKKALREAGSGVDDLAEKVKMAGVAMGTAFAAKKAFDLAKLGATAERVERRFEAFADSAGGASKILEAFQEGAGGAASKMDAMLSASKLLQMGLVTNADEMAQTVEMATRLGDQTMSVSDRVADFAAMLANQSIPRLDNFGISSANVRARIQELQAATADMSREEAFAIAVREEGAKALDVLGERTDDSLASFENLDAKIDDLTVAIGQAFAPALAGIVGITADVVSGLIPLFNWLEKIMNLAGQAKKEADASADAALDFAGTWLDATHLASETAYELGDAMDVIRKKSLHPSGDIAELWINFEKGEAGFHRALIEASTDFDEYLAAIERFNELMPHANFEQDAMSKAVYASIRGIDSLNDQERELVRWLDEALSGWADQRRAMRGVSEEVQNYYQANVDLIKWQNMAADAALLHGTSIDQLGSSQEAVWEMAAAAPENVGAYEEAMARMAAAAATAAEKHVALATGLKEATDAQIASALIGMLEIGEDALTPEQYITAATDIGLAFGTMDEKSVALATNLPILAGYINDLVIPADLAGEALGIMIDNVEGGDEPLIGIAELISGMVEPTGYVAKNTQTFNEALAEVPGPAESATEAMGGFAGSVGEAKRELKEAITQTGTLKDKIGELPSEKTVTIRVKVVGDEVPSYQHGGVVPGPIGAPQLAIVHGGERYLGAPGATTNHNNHFNMTINTRARHEPIIADFRMMEAMLGR